MERSAQHFTTEDFLTIPQEMRDIPQWVAWRAEQRGGKTTKIPINIATGRGAKTNDPATWASFDDAIGYWEEGAGASGVGSLDAALMRSFAARCPMDAGTGAAAWRSTTGAAFS